ncbi:MAG: helix-turn-helix transcriptional regulator [Methanoregulaceae archaeon]|jgi:DNA-binding transcriptional ArsR family regulator|nr:helix-turn-helix transcriptional regulator [Methanoregulaceae archaeon]MCC7468226.1 helix-turn-helix transcriptional regulator [Burkholderiaceae bacterium]NLH25971.1 helix-turn-helix transcriptional regulator [Methanomicrobiales archaeon]HOU81136.1 helix-turn-helix domain-containing protein [Methanoregulaceae archaeon]HPS23839.1 helix-turn-helix domain-containing protein [Methanoregulaceae archaeon]
MTEEIIVIEPGDERAQKIGKAIGSPMANEILQILAGGPKTASDLTDLLNIPMGTLKYHIDNLLEAGLIEIAETRYSVKGREVKVYALRDQLLIVAPKVASVRSILLKYASLFAIVVLASMAMFAILPLLDVGTTQMTEPASFQIDRSAGGGEGASILAEKATAPAAAPALPSSVPMVLAFFLGGCLVLLVLILYEAYRWQKGYSP